MPPHPAHATLVDTHGEEPAAGGEDMAKGQGGGAWGPLSPMHQSGDILPQPSLKYCPSHRLRHVTQSEGRPQGQLGPWLLTPRPQLCPLGQPELEPDTESESWTGAKGHPGY